MKLRNSYDNSSSVKDLVSKPDEWLNPRSTHYDRTQQSMAESCNINNILKKVAAGQEFPDQANMNFEDVSNVPNLAQMHEQVIKAQEGFSTLPIAVRKRYNHDPNAFIQALVDPDEKEFLTKYGVFQTPKEEKPDYLKIIAENTSKSGDSTAAQLPS